MKYISKAFLCLCVLVGALFARQKIDNIQFKDLDGNNYDLYQTLEKGHYIVIHMQFNG